MPVDANALTLAEYAKQSNSPLVKSITMSLYNTPNVIKDIPLITSAVLEMKGKRVTGNLPGVNWRRINEVPVVVKGFVDDYEEQGWLVRNQFQADKRLLNQPNAIGNPLDFQYKMWEEGFAYDFNTKFINNDHGTGDPNAFVGLRSRIDNGTKYGVNPAMKIDFGGVDISASGITKASADGMIRIVQQMLDEMNVPDGDGVVFYGNSALLRGWESAIRTLGAGAGFNTQDDAYGRKVRSYRNAKIRDIGRRVDQSTPVIGAETSTGLDSTGANYTSIYAVRYGADTFGGWQGEALTPVDLGIDPTNGIMRNVMIDWMIGIWQQHTRAICRGFDIKVS